MALTYPKTRYHVRMKLPGRVYALAQYPGPSQHHINLWQVCNPNNLPIEAAGLGVQYHPGLHSEVGGPDNLPQKQTKGESCSVQCCAVCPWLRAPVSVGWGRPGSTALKGFFVQCIKSSGQPLRLQAFTLGSQGSHLPLTRASQIPCCHLMGRALSCTE